MNNKNHKYLFILTLFISGFCGISYEILYSRILGNVIGNHFALNSSILLMFLLGIGIGTKISYRFSGFLWLIELLIGAYAILFSLSVPYLDTLFFNILPSGSLLVNTLTCSVLLALPTILIGISLPLFAGLFKEVTQSEKIFDLSYMIYNFGASITAFIIEFYLIRAFGIKNSVLMISFLNIFTGSLLFIFFRKIKIELEEEESFIYDKKIVIPLILLSFSSAIFQLLILKISEFIFGPFSETFAMIISLTLFGIALGSMLTRFVKLSFTFFCLANIANLILVLTFFSDITLFYSSYYSSFSGDYIILFKMFVLSIIMLINSISFGAAIPTLLVKESNVAKESGHLLFISSLANAFGYFIMIFFIHSFFKYGQIFLLISVLLSIALLIHKNFKKELLISLLTINILGFVSLSKIWNENILYINYTSFTNKSDYLYSTYSYREGTQYKKYEDVFSLNKIGNDVYFMINGYVSMALNMAAEYVVGAVSSMVSPKIDNALVLGLGSGSTSGTVSQIFNHTDVIEINPVVIEHEHEMKEYNFDIVNNKKVNIVCDDGIRFLKNTDKKYDLILNTVTSPLYFRSSKLYTTDFIKVVKSKLTDEGIYTTWIDLRIGDEGLDIILKSLSKEFKYGWAAQIKSAYFVLVLSNKELKLHQEEKINNNEVLSNFFFSKHGRNIQDIKYAFTTDDVFKYLKEREKNKIIDLNTLDKPSLEFKLAKLRNYNTNIGEFVNFLTNDYDFERMNKNVFNGKFDGYNLLKYNLQVSTESQLTKSIYSKVIGSDINKFSVLKTLFYQKDLFENLEKYKSPELFDEVNYWTSYFNESNNAEEILKRQIELFPKYERAYRNLGIFYFRNKDFKKAEDFFKKHLDLASDNMNISYYWLGKIYFEKGNMLQAEEYLLKSIKLDYSKDEALYLLAKIYYERKEIEKAKKYVIDASLLDNEDESYLNLLAKIYYEQKDYTNAQITLNRLFEVNKDNIEASKLQNQIYKEKL